MMAAAEFVHEGDLESARTLYVRATNEFLQLGLRGMADSVVKKIAELDEVRVIPPPNNDHNGYLRLSL
jgi:hypothetical protein